MSPPPRAVRIFVAAIVAAVLGTVWVLAAAMFATGIVMWRDWHALARDGVVAEARVEHCTWESMHANKRLTFTRGSGFYSCDYLYRIEEPGPVYSGHFQSPRRWQVGEAIAIRYRRDRPSASATLKDLEHPSVAPGALILLPLLYAAWQVRAPLRRVFNRPEGAASHPLEPPLAPRE